MALKMHNIKLHDKKYKTKMMVLEYCTWQNIETKLTEIIYNNSKSSYSYMESVENLLKYFNWEYDGMK